MRACAGISNLYIATLRRAHPASHRRGGVEMFLILKLEAVNVEHSARFERLKWGLEGS